jgi:hypothetical protein
MLLTSSRSGGRADHIKSKKPAQRPIPLGGDLVRLSTASNALRLITAISGGPQSHRKAVDESRIPALACGPCLCIPHRTAPTSTSARSNSQARPSDRPFFRGIGSHLLLELEGEPARPRVFRRTPQPAFHQLQPVPDQKGRSSVGSLKRFAMLQAAAHNKVRLRKRARWRPDLIQNCRVLVSMGKPSVFVVVVAVGALEATPASKAS